MQPPDSGKHWIGTTDGRRLFVEVHGKGSPVVVLEAGMGASRNTWGGVIPLLAPHMTVVAYDRSGLGRSDPDPAPRDLNRLAEDLKQVLGDFDGPFVLAGHSWGGPIIRSAAAGQPERVAGLVLVDQTDEHCDIFFTPAAARQNNLALRVMPLAARIGLVRLVVRRLARDLPEPWAASMKAEDGTVAAVAAQMAELKEHVESLRQLRDNPLVLPEVPTAVISGTKDGFGERKRRHLVVDAHAATAAALGGTHVLAEGSSHYVPLTEPEIVAREILTIVDSIRG